MRPESFLSRLLIAVTLVITAVVVMPSGAQAHASHGYAVQHAGPTPQRPVDARTAPIAGRDEATVRRTEDGASPSLLSVSGPETPQTCPGGCCHSAGTGCCAAWLPASPDILVPVLGRSAPIITVIGGAGITPGALPKPPNSLV